MADNKKHHFVPRFYLKRFSADGKSINLWNIRNQLKISHGKLKSQCYRDYFYGKEPDSEKALGQTEGHAAEIFRVIDHFGAPPPPMSPEHLMLAVFVLAQYGRTAHSVDALEDMTDKMMKHILAPRAEAEGIDISGVKIGLTNIAAFSVGLTVHNYPLILDLHYKLVINQTKVEFVTSDNPLVLYNQLFAFRRFGSNTGIASKGLQIFLPISPDKMLVFYDSEVYSVGPSNKSVVDVIRPQDVYELNTLQMVSASENVYFENDRFDVQALHRKAQPFFRDRLTTLSVFSGEESEQRRSEFLASSREDVRTNLSLSFMRTKRSAKKWRGGFKKQDLQPAAVVRNERLCSDHEEFTFLVKEGKFEVTDFFEFLNHKYGQSEQDVTGDV